MGRDKLVVDELPRPMISAQRYRELEKLSYSIMMMAPDDLGECLVVRDICTNIMRRWLTDERMAEHEIAARKGTPLMAVPGGNIIHLKPVDPA